jgi:HK97 family phage portal protein
MAVIRKIGNNELWRDSKKVMSLELLNSANIEVVEKIDENRIDYFRYTDQTTKKVENIPYDECIYWHIPDPIRPHQPLPLILAGLLSVQSSLEMEKQYNATLKNGGTIDGLFRFKEGVSVEKSDQLKRDYAKLLRDNKDGKIPLILGGDASFERIALSPQELQTLESKQLLIDDLIAVTGVPKAILGLATGDTYSIAETAYRIFLRETIKPIMKDLVNMLDWKLIPPQYTLDFVDPTPEDIETNLRKLESGSRVGALTLNEKREMLGLPPVDKDGDEIERPAEKPQPDEEKKTLFNHPLRIESFRDGYYTEFLKNFEGDRRKFKSALLKYFEGQKKRVLEAIAGMKTINQKDFAFDLLNEPLEVSYMLPILKTMEEIARKEGQRTMDLFGGGVDFFYNSGVDKAVSDRFNFLATQVNQTTADILQNEVTDWFENKETIAELSQRISDIYDFRKDEKWRADTITNTEVNSVINLTKGEAYKQIGVPVKIWVHRGGIKGGVRDDHASMDGEEVPFNKSFSNGMMHPQDPAFGPEDNVNCMCTW